MLSLLGLAAQPAAVCAATVSITFAPPVTLGGTGYVDAEQFPSGALAAANAEHVLARGAAASASWHAETVSGMGATASCTADPASCPGVCDVKTKHSREEKCPTAPEYYRWGGEFSPDLVDGRRGAGGLWAAAARRREEPELDCTEPQPLHVLCIQR